MPYILIGRYSFDLGRVELVERTVGSEGGVTITLFNGTRVELGGQDAAAFLKAWDDHAAPQPIERGPPRVLVPRLIVPDDAVHPDRRVEEGFVVGNGSGRHDQA